MRYALISDESELQTMNTKASFQKENKLIKNINNQASFQIRRH